MSSPRFNTSFFTTLHFAQLRHRNNTLNFSTWPGIKFHIGVCTGKFCVTLNWIRGPLYGVLLLAQWCTLLHRQTQYSHSHRGNVTWGPDVIPVTQVGIYELIQLLRNWTLWWYNRQRSRQTCIVSTCHIYMWRSTLNVSRLHELLSDCHSSWDEKWSVIKCIH